jgi:hypothetical protein
MDRCGRFALAALLLLVAACGIQVPSQAPASPALGNQPAPPFAADLDRIQAHLAALQAVADEHGGIRFVGTAGYEASVDVVADALRNLGFEVETPEVAFTGFSELPGAELTVGERTFRAPDELHALIYSPGGEVSGRIAVLDDSGCEADHFAEIEVGAVVLTTRGGCFRRQQALHAADAGAAALLVGYPDRGPGEIFRPTLIDPDGITIPVVSVTADAVRALEAAADPVFLVVETEREPAMLRNVVAQIGDGPHVVMLGAHLDSVLEGPGINDNGSGVAALLEVARGVAAAGVPDGTAIRIALWGGEELGTVGSRAYIDSLGDEDIGAYINLDMAGSPDGANLVYAETAAADGSMAITEAFEAWFAARGQPTDRIDLGGSSDHFAFIQAGIPTGGLFAGATGSGSAAQPGSGATGGEPADACYHLGCDDLDNVDLARVALFAEATLAVAYELIAAR